LTKKKFSSSKARINLLGARSTNTIGINENNKLKNSSQKENDYNQTNNNINSEDEYENRPITARNLGVNNNNSNNSMENVLINAETVEEVIEKIFNFK